MYHNFIADCLQGEVTLGELENYVDHWHEAENDEGSLQDFLGLTTYEYKFWLQHDNDEVFQDILYCRRNKITLEEYFVTLEKQQG